MKAIHTHLKVYNFADYRDFLNAFYTYERYRDKGFSIRTWCRRLGLKSPASIHMILSGKRHAGNHIVEAMSHYFGFSSKEKQYFEDLVKIAKCEEPEGKKRLLRRLATTRGKNDFDHFDKDVFAILASWHVIAILELVKLRDFVCDPLWIQRRLRFRLSLPAIIKAIDCLKKKNLIALDDKGVYQVSYPNLLTTNDVTNKAIQNFHDEMIQLAKQAVHSIPTELRQVSGMTFNIKTSDILTVKAEIWEFQQQLMARYQSDGGDQTYQFNAQLFPLTR